MYGAFEVMARHSSQTETGTKGSVKEIITFPENTKEALRLGRTLYMQCHLSQEEKFQGQGHV